MYKQLEKLMAEHNESPADLSKATGISQALLSMWKKREGGMSLENAMKIAEHYEIDVRDLIGGK